MTVPSSASTSQPETDFYPAGILFDDTPWTYAPATVRDVVQGMLNFKGTIPPDCQMTVWYQAQGLHDRIACVSADRELVERIYYERGSKLEEAIFDDQAGKNPTWQQPVSVALACMLNDERNFAYLRDTCWTAPCAPNARGSNLGRPTPTFTVGFRSSEQTSIPCVAKPRKPLRSAKNLLLLEGPKDAPPVDPFMREAIRAMILRMGSGFMPYADEAHPELIYPCLCFAIGTESSSKAFQISQLGASLCLALGILIRLKRRMKDQDELPVMIFGATSVGELWTLFVAYEPEPYQYGIDCHICTIWSGRVESGNTGLRLEFLWLMERISQWALETLRPRIKAWLRTTNGL